MTAVEEDPHGYSQCFVGRGSPRSVWRLVRWPLLGALAALAFVLGYIGFQVHFTQLGISRSVSDLAYLTLQLFTLQSGDVAGPVSTRLMSVTCASSRDTHPPFLVRADSVLAHCHPRERRRSLGMIDPVLRFRRVADETEIVNAVLVGRVIVRIRCVRVHTEDGAHARLEQDVHHTFSIRRLAQGDRPEHPVRGPTLTKSLLKRE